MPKQKTHKGLKKRIRITKYGLIKFKPAFGRHLRSRKSSSLLRSYRRPAFCKTSEVKRLQPIIGVRVRSPENRPVRRSADSSPSDAG